MSEKLKYAKLIIKFYIKWNENELKKVKITFYY